MQMVRWLALGGLGFLGSCAPSTSPGTPVDRAEEGAAAPASADAESRGGASQNEARGGSATKAQARSASVFIIHQVPNFDAYLEQFAGNADAREQAGVTGVVMVRLSEEQERVGLHFTAGSVASIDQFLGSKEFDQLLEKDRATNSMLLWIADDVLNQLPSTIEPGSASLFKKFPAQDVDCVSRGLTVTQKDFEEAGLLGFSLHRTKSREDVLILHLVGSSEEGVRRLYQEPVAKVLASCGASEFDHPIVGLNQPLPTDAAAR